MLRLAAPFLLILTLVAAAVWVDDPAPPAEFTFVNRGEVFTLDPQRMSWMQDFRMAYALYEPLVRWNNRDFSVEPAVATAWERSEDGRTYTFRLRDDARWSNGEPVTAHDYVWSWSRAMLPDTAADYSMMFFAIEGAKDFFDWRTGRIADHARLAADLAPERQRAAAEALWRETEARFEATVGLKALDRRTLEVRLVRPVPYFLDLVAFGVFHPVHRPSVEGWEVDEATAARMREAGWHAVETPPFAARRWVSLNAATGQVEQKHEWTKPGRLVSNGPYVLADWRYRRGMRLERNPHYHSPTLAKSDSISVLSIEDGNTAVLAFETGEIDWLSDVSVDYQPDMLRQRERYLDRHRARLDALLAEGRNLSEAMGLLPEPEDGERRNIHVFPTFGTDFYSFNCRPTLADGRPNPFADPRVRRAFVLATDREAIVTQVTRLNEPIVTTLIPEGSIPGYESPDGLGYDPVRAREELAAAGWSDRDGDGVVEDDAGRAFPAVDLLFSTNTPRYKNISLALKDMWQRELRVNVALRGKDNKAFKEDLKRGDFMVGRGRWYGDYGDPTTFLDLFRTGDGNNDRGYSNPEIDAMLDRAAVETDPEKRMEIFKACEKKLFQEEVPMLVLCQLVQLYMFEPGEVRGLSTHPRLVQYLWQMERAPAASGAGGPPALARETGED